MSIKFSKYVRQGKKTFRFISTSGGVYGSNVAYEYGYFNGNRLDGISHFYHSETEIESDPDERDGIGSMHTIRKRSTWLGSFKDGKMDGFCIPLTQTSKELENKMEKRTSYMAGRGERSFVSVVEDMPEEIVYEAVCPILSEGDIIGAVILLESDNKRKMNDGDMKLIQAAAGFLGKQMEH